MILLHNVNEVKRDCQMSSIKVSMTDRIGLLCV